MDLTPHQPLRDSLAFWLLRTANAIRLHHGDVLADSGVTLNQFLILKAVRDGGRSRPSAVARILGVHPSDVTRMVQRLAAKGLIRRSRTAEDQRAVHLALSEKGEALLARIEVTVERADRMVLEGLGPDAARHLRDWLQAVLTRSGRWDLEDI